jgi:integrase
MAVRKIRNSWWIDVRADHRRIRKKSPENTRAGAVAYEAVLRQKLARGSPIAEATAERAQTFEEFVPRWVEAYVLPNNKFSEQRAKRGVLRNALVPYFGKKRMGEITSYHIERFKGQQLKSGLAKSTIRNHLTVLNKCLACAYEWLKLDGVPPKTKWPKCPTPETRYLSADECELLLAHARGMVREMILTALRTGMRQGEIKGLQWQSIDWETRSVVIQHSFCDVRKVLDTPKSNRSRYIPLDVDVFELLYRRKKTSGFVFLDSDNGKPFNSPRLNLRLAMVCRAAGVKRVTWHVLRHTFATQLAMKGTPLNIVQALLGHASITTTMRYAHVAPSALRTAIDMLNPKTALAADLGQPAGSKWVEREIAQRLVA